MRKSSLILLLVAAFVLATAAAGFSAEPCKKICKNWDWDLHIQRDYTCTPPGQTTPGSCPACPVFDYENKYNYCYGGERYIIMKVCDCEEYDPSSPLWAPDATYGFRIEILEPQKGVYFTNMNNSAPSNCTFAGECNNPTNSDGYLYASVLKYSEISDIDNTCPELCTDGTPVQYSYVPVDSSQQLYDAVNPVEPCCLDCIGNLTKSIRTECALQLFQGAGGLPYVMLDIPSLVWDPKVINDGDTVKIKVTLVSGEGDEAICPSCKDLCSCIVDIGIFGCVSNPTQSWCDLCMPYFTSVDDAWWSGFAITNSAGSVATVNVNFYAGGAQIGFTDTITGHSVKVWALSEIDGIENLSGKGPIYATVKGTYPASNGGTSAAAIDGFAIMGDGAQAYGYLAKHGRCGCSSK